MEIEVIDATHAHIRELAKNLRNDDRHEIESYGIPIYRGLRSSFRGSLICKAVLVDNKVAAIFGVGGTNFGDKGIPWLLTTPVCEQVSALKFCRIYQEELLKLLKLFKHLENFVSAEYYKSIKLLDNIGFTLSEPEPMGKNGAMFRKFSMRKAL